MTDDQIKADCESRFQNGTSRNQIINSKGRFVRSADSAAMAVRLMDEGDRVFARRKVPHEKRYAWVCVATKK